MVRFAQLAVQVAACNLSASHPTDNVHQMTVTPLEIMEIHHILLNIYGRICVVVCAHDRDRDFKKHFLIFVLRETDKVARAVHYISRNNNKADTKTDYAWSEVTRKSETFKFAMIFAFIVRNRRAMNAIEKRVMVDLLRHNHNTDE